MWEIQGKNDDAGRFSALQPVDVLYEFEGPRLFTVADIEEELCLACWSDEDDQVSRFVVVPTTSTIVDSMRAGSISVFEALNQPRCWLCDLSHQWQVVACWRVSFGDIPREALPSPGTMLWPSLEPLTAIHTSGNEIKPGQIPGSIST